MGQCLSCLVLDSTNRSKLDWLDGVMSKVRGGRIEGAENIPGDSDESLGISIT